MTRIETIQQGSGFVIPLWKTESGFQTAWEKVEDDLPKLPENTRITRIDTDIEVKEGAIGKGYVTVDTITSSSSGTSRYVWVTVAQFEHIRDEKTQRGSGTNYRSHVVDSHNDTATPRANQPGMPYSPSSR